MATVNFHETVGAGAGRGILAEILFPDLASAGRALALQLAAYRDRTDVVVLGLVLGGVPVAQEVAKWLAVPLDLVIIRRLLAPRGPGSQTCAVSVGGTLVIDADLPPRPITPSTPLDAFIADALCGLEAREQLCRAGRPAINLANKTIILVDCGMRTGSTMQAAIVALQTREPAQIIAAVPVASPESRQAVADKVYELVCLEWPDPFGHVGMWYKDFRRPGDEGLSELLCAQRP